MKRSVIAIAAIGALIATPAFEADMAVKAPPPPPPAWTWTGCYVGIEGGEAIGHDRVVATASGTTVTTVSPNGGLFGGTIGCNYQFSQFVIGVEERHLVEWFAGNGQRSEAIQHRILSQR